MSDETTRRPGNYGKHHPTDTDRADGIEPISHNGGVDNHKLRIRSICGRDDPALAQIIRNDLSSFGLDVPGTAYFDPELDHLNLFYTQRENRHYYVIEDESGQALGGAGIAEIAQTPGTAEFQKLYLSDAARGHHMGYALIARVEEFAATHGYKWLYVETHHRMAAANHIYVRSGFHRIDGPLAGSVHGAAMDRFYIKEVPHS
ncbi:GNAT family N-acetyltransferase [uncultured Bifidobacterium sp.]|uniref:GNAT family N-acetyltransferase n=1 Tax=uncultured Bifidobacterium sp. TaxID=165187 RepID=UPI00260874BC|nr:GNAT family N-acetyltransferase [uncultured Bifidobacterium sp.]